MASVDFKQNNDSKTAKNAGNGHVFGKAKESANKTACKVFCKQDRLLNFLLNLPIFKRNSELFWK